MKDTPQENRKPDLVKNKDETFGTGVLYQYFAAVVFMLAGSLFFIFLTKVLPTSDVGNIALLLAIVQLFSIVFSLGMKGAMEHYLSYYKGKGEESIIKGIVTRYGAITLILGILAFFVTFVLSGLISRVFYHSPIFAPLIKLLGIDIALAMGFTVLTGMTTGIQHFKGGARIYMVGSVSVYSLAVLFLIIFESVYFAVIGWILGYSIGIILYVIHILRYSGSLPSGNYRIPVRKVLGYSTPLFAASLLFYGSTYVDRLIVAAFLNLSLLGIYNLALLVAQGIAFFINPLNNLLLPKFSEMFSRNDLGGIRNGVSAVGNLLTLIYAPISVGVAVLSPSIMITLGNGNYVPGSFPLTILVLVSAVFVTQFVLVQALSGSRKTSVFLYATAASFTGNLVFSLVLIPRFGLTGAAVANSIAPAISFTVIVLFSMRQKVASFDLSSIARIWISSIVMGTGVYFLQAVMHYSAPTLAIGIVMGFAIYLALVKITGSLKRESAQLLASLFPPSLFKIKKVIMAVATE